MIEKNLSEITKAEWVTFNWFDNQEFGSPEERLMVRGSRRTPDEAMQAQINWDETADLIKEALEADNVKSGEENGG
jgi:hypothetical protein